MPKVTIHFSIDQFLALVNRDVRAPGRVISIVPGCRVLDEDGSFGVGAAFVVMIDLDPIVDYGTAFTFATFMSKVFPGNDISSIEDPEDYAVLENMLAAVSMFDLYSFDWID